MHAVCLVMVHACMRLYALFFSIDLVKSSTEYRMISYYRRLIESFEVVVYRIIGTYLTYLGVIIHRSMR